MSGAASQRTRTNDQSSLSLSCSSLSYPPHFSFHYSSFLRVSALPRRRFLLLYSSAFLFIFLITPSLFLFKIPCLLHLVMSCVVLLSISLSIHSLLTLLTHLSLCRTALGCVFGRGNGSSWLISVCSTTKVSLCVMLEVNAFSSE